MAGLIDAIHMKRKKASLLSGSFQYRLAFVAISILITVNTVDSSQSETTQKQPVTFTRDVVPILQRSCQRCHRADSIAPMSLLTYEEVRPWARAIKRETSSRQMPPWYVEKEVGIKAYRDDPSLTKEEIATLAAWADNGAARGNPKDQPPPIAFQDTGAWSIGTPDLIVSSPPITIEATAPDWWGAIGNVPTGLTEDRYVAAIEILEKNDSSAGPIFHHAGLVSLTANGEYELGSIHEVGRNAETYDPAGGKFMQVGGTISFNNAHVHANGSHTTAYLDVGFKFHPRGYRPQLEIRPLTLGSPELDIKGNESEQMFEAFTTLLQPIKLVSFEPHMHAAGSRMCLEAIWGTVRQTLSCVGFNPAWVRNYSFETDSAPLLPRGTILRLVGWMDTTPNPDNPYLTDYRNWTGWGSRPVDNMFMNYLTVAFLSETQLQATVTDRQKKVTQGQGELTGCLPCTIPQALGLTTQPQ